MNNRHLLRTVLLFSTATAALFASRAAADDNSAPPPPPPQHGPGQPGGIVDPERRLAFLTKQLGLTPEQQEKLRPILVEQAEAAKKQAEAGKKIDDVLTQEQRDKLSAMRLGPRGGHGKHDRRDEGTPPDAE